MNALQRILRNQVANCGHACEGVLEAAALAPAQFREELLEIAEWWSSEAFKAAALLAELMGAHARAHGNG